MPDETEADVLFDYIDRAEACQESKLRRIANIISDETQVNLWPHVSYGEFLNGSEYTVKWVAEPLG